MMRVLSSLFFILFLVLGSGFSGAALTVGISGAQNAAFVEISYNPLVNVTFMENNSYTQTLQEKLVNLTGISGTNISVSSNSAIFGDLNERIKSVNSNLYVTNLSYSVNFFTRNNSRGLDVFPDYSYSYVINNIVNRNAVTVN